MLRTLLTLGLLAAALAALVPAASAGPLVCTSPPIDHNTVGLACGGANTAYDTAFWAAGVPNCLLTTAPINWASCANYSTTYPGSVVGYALCYGNTGVLHWVGTCT